MALSWFCLLSIVALCHGHARIPLERISLLEVPSALSTAEVSLAPAKSFGYVGKIGLGNPPQELLILMDTGSSHLWVPSSKICNTNLQYCEQHNTFDQTKSKTFKNLNKSNALYYAAGSVRGNVGKDTLRIDDQSMGNVSLLVVNSISGNVAKNTPMDGILGLSYMKTLFPGEVINSKTNLIQKPIYSFYFAKNNEPGSELIIGGSDSSLYEGELTNLTVVPNKANYLQVSMPSLKFDGVEYCSGGCTAVLDTGTTNIGVPKGVIQRIMNNIVQNGACSRISTLPTINLNLEDTQFTLESEYYMDTEKGCGVHFYNSDAGNDFWVLGTVFLQKYYTMYDLTSRTIGIAPSV